MHRVSLGRFAVAPASTGRGSVELEAVLVQVSEALWWPVVGLIALVVGYTLVQLGAFLMEALMRFTGSPTRALVVKDGPETPEALELLMVKQLEGLRICSRVGPMLGLIATMVPLGPALSTATSGADGDALARLGGSFASVILALAAASIAFAVHTVRRRWLIEELSAQLGPKPHREDSHD
ncbi:MAG: MotA/TolQ/ExbB proton channel family protein [Planctomycetota bacterium]